MLTDDEINEIEVKHISTTRAPSERTWEDEVWIIGHLKEIVTSYRRDIPKLLADRRKLLEQIEQRETEVADLLEVCNGIRDIFGYDRDDGIDLVTYATVDYSKLRNALHEVFLKYPVDWSKETNAIMEELFALHPKETPHAATN